MNKDEQQNRNKVDSNKVVASFAQQRLWLLDQFSEGGSQYNIYRAIKLAGALDKEVLQQTLNEMSQRHEVFRTQFIEEDGRPFQIILDTVEINLAIIDIHTTSPNEREAEISSIIEREVNRPFDLQIAPLFRASLITVSATEFVFVYVMHHIISDGWSMAIINRELSALYNALSQNRPSLTNMGTMKHARCLQGPIWSIVTKHPGTRQLIGSV